MLLWKIWSLKRRRKKGCYDTKHDQFTQLLIFKVILDFKDSFRLTRQFLTAKKVAGCQNSWKLSRKVHTNSVSQDNCWPLKTIAIFLDCFAGFTDFKRRILLALFTKPWHEWALRSLSILPNLLSIAALGLS